MQLRMHPTDSRMASWGPITYTVGSSIPGSVPMAIVKDNNPLTIKVHRNAYCSRYPCWYYALFCRMQASGRGEFFQGHDTSCTNQDRLPWSDSWRLLGLRKIYNYVVPAGTLVRGSNTVEISCTSGVLATALSRRMSSWMP